MMLHISALQRQVAKDRQLFGHSIRTYRVGGKHCKRMASLYGKHSRGRISYLKVKIKIPLI